MLASKHSNINITMNERDSADLFRIYDIKTDLSLPFCIQDEQRKNITYRDHINHRLLFIGSSFYANIEAMEWFCGKVLAYLNCELIIVGNGFESQGSNKKLSNATIIGRVDDLEKYYSESDIVIAPIFSGSGMKTKIAESLMFGRPIIGTKEAFTGYHDNINEHNSP